MLAFSSAFTSESLQQFQTSVEKKIEDLKGTRTERIECTDKLEDVLKFINDRQGGFGDNAVAATATNKRTGPDGPDGPGVSTRPSKRSRLADRLDSVEKGAGPLRVEVDQLLSQDFVVRALGDEALTSFRREFKLWWQELEVRHSMLRKLFKSLSTACRERGKLDSEESIPEESIPKESISEDAYVPILKFLDESERGEYRKSLKDQSTPEDVYSRLAVICENISRRYEKHGSKR